MGPVALVLASLVGRDGGGGQGIDKTREAVRLIPLRFLAYEEGKREKKARGEENGRGSGKMTFHPPGVSPLPEIWI